METFSRLPRRLTQLYSDTKTSCDAVVEQDTPEPLTEDNALHRKYRIQKNRLITWGLEWSDNTKDKQGDIDESVERAGLTETVTSVLGTIKDILDEAERMQAPALHTSAKTMSGEKHAATVALPSDPASWAASDRERYEDLAKDLTTSIDILYDLSRSRRVVRDAGAATPVPAPITKSVSEPTKPPANAARSIFSSLEYSASDVTLINPATIPANLSLPSPRSNLPPKLDPSDLILPQEEPPPYESVGDSCAIRVIGKVRSRHSSTNPWKTDGSKSIETPVLVEYAAFDPTYRFTQVSPSLERLESLLAILSRLESEQSFHGTLKCRGYFEDPKHPRFGIVYELPNTVYSGASDSMKSNDELQPVTLLSVLQTGSKSLHNSNSATPPLEDRFRLAFTLALTFSKIHGDRFVHKDVNSSNILVFKKSRRQSANSRALQYALRSPVICSFDLFSEFDIDPPNKMPPLNIYRHPEDPRYTGEKEKEHGPQFDLYSLGLILLEIGLWVPLSDLWKTKYTLADFKQRVEDVYIRRLASKCGTAYMQGVRDCFWAADRIASGAESLDNFSQLYNRILIRLQRCCLLDETDASFELGDLNSSVASAFNVSPLKRKSQTLNAQAAEHPQSPSHRSAKRWALEKGSQYLERTRSLSKSLADVTTSPKGSPNPSALSRNGSQRSLKSQHSIRKSISHGIHNFKSPVEEQPHTMDWEYHQRTEPTNSLDNSGTLVASNPITPIFPNDKGDVSSLHKEQILEAAAIIQRAWRASRDAPHNAPQRSLTLRDYKDKITVIQKAWRDRKEKERTNTVQTLINVANTQMLGYAATPQRNLAYPTPEPESQSPKMQEQPRIDTSVISIQRDAECKPRPKLRLHRLEFPENIVNEWHGEMLPRLERLIERVLKNSDETVCIDLLAIGDTPEKARPTIVITCNSVARVKALLDQRFRYDHAVYDLKIRRGKVRRSKMNRSSRRSKLPHVSMANTSNQGDVQVMNPYHQQRPICGASIGAFRGEHLPPVSYGGVILVDDEPLGMSVHHLLDAPSDDESDSGDDDDDDDMSPSPNDVMLSSARGGGNSWLSGIGSQPGVQVDPGSYETLWSLEISDDEDTKSDYDDQESFDFSSDDEYDSEDESDDNLADSMASRATIGDIDGIPLGEGEDIKITQPAIDDIDDDFFPCEEDRDDDHLASHELGHVHASSGIRRWKRGGITHEIDWALLKLNDDRLQPYNLVQGGRRFCATPVVAQDQQEIATKLAQPVNRNYYAPNEDEYPNGVASADRLGGLNVHCFGRTTGLQGGMVGYQMSSVRIYRRKTFSRSWHVAGGFGVGGDSGAWVIQNGSHRVIGHVLAWCDRNHIAYICPMEVLLEDIKRTLGAKRIYLPGSKEEIRHRSQTRAAATSPITHTQTQPQQQTSTRDLEVAIEGLGIIDSAIDVGRVPNGTTVNTNGAPTSPKRSRLHQHLPQLTTSGESDKENLPKLKSSRVIKVKEARGGHHGLEVEMEMVGVP